MKATLRLLLLLMLLAGSFFGCKREQRQFQVQPSSANAVQTVALTTLHAGDTEKQVAFKNRDEDRAQDLSDGKRLFAGFNCVGCHGHGGGGSGPALMDDQWVYGSDPDQIFSTIIQGRPKGMPSFAGKIPDGEVWKITAYVRSLSGLASKDAANGRSDHMQGKKPENSIKTEEPKNVTSP